MISHLLSVHLEYPPKLGKHVFRAALPSKTCYRQLDCKADEESAVIDLSKGIRSTLLSCCWQLVLTCFKATGTSFIRYMVPTDLYKNSRLFHLVYGTERSVWEQSPLSPGIWYPLICTRTAASFTWPRSGELRTQKLKSL